MVTDLRPESPPGTSLKSLVNGFVLTKQTEGKSPRTIEFYSENLKRFLWYAQKQGWTDDIRMLTAWQIKEFLGYVGSETHRWELHGNSSESSLGKASHTTVHHYFVAISCLFNWVIKEGFLKDNPLTHIKVAKPKPKVIIPYSQEEIKNMLAVCDYDFQHNAKFLACRNQAMILTLLDSGVRLSELVGITLNDIDTEKGWLKIRGKGSKERIVRVGKTTQKAIWRYCVYRPKNGRQELWLSEEGKPLAASGVQSLIQRLMERAGITSDGSTHRFRHTFALNFLRADKNVFNLQYLLGHSDLDMVRRYTSTLGMEDALKAHEKASPVDLMCLK